MEHDVSASTEQSQGSREKGGCDLGAVLVSLCDWRFPSAEHDQLALLVQVRGRGIWLG